MQNILVYTDLNGTWAPEECRCIKIKILSTLTISEEFDGKSQPVLQGQNREF